MTDGDYEYRIMVPLSRPQTIYHWAAGQLTTDLTAVGQVNFAIDAVVLRRSFRIIRKPTW